MTGDKQLPRLNWTRSEVILACSLLANNNWKWMHPSDPRALELSELLRRSPEHPRVLRGPAFRNPNGVVRKMQDLQSRLPDYEGVPTHGSRIDREVLREFLDDRLGTEAVAQRVRDVIRRDEVTPESVAEVEADPELSAVEGAVVIAAHLRRERNARLRGEKVRRVCEVCGFDFAAVYGTRGEGYIEVHHSLPLHVSGSTATRMSDLTLLRANCHRMIHRGKHWVTPAELKKSLNLGAS